MNNSSTCSLNTFFLLYLQLHTYFLSASYSNNGCSASFINKPTHLNEQTLMNKLHPDEQNQPLGFGQPPKRAASCWYSYSLLRRFEGSMKYLPTKAAQNKCGGRRERFEACSISIIIIIVRLENKC